MYDGNSLAIGWPDIRNYGYENYDEYLHCIEEEEEEGKMKSKIENIAWCLPRPRKIKYPGGFPLHAEIKILREIGCDPKKNKDIKILHPFGGRAEYGVRVDIKPEVYPDYVGDAHNMDFIQNESYDCVILDPPYNEEYSKRLYGTGKPQWKKYTTEAVRVLKEGGYLVVYHCLATPCIENTILIKRIFLETRLWHKLRCIHIHQKKNRIMGIK